MSTPLAVSCPHCGAGLKLKNNNFVGKKVPCPKCKKPFLVEQPPEDEFLSEDDDFGAMEDVAEEEEEEAPRSKGKSKSEPKSAKGKGKSKKKSKSGGGFAPIAMIAGGVVLGIGLLGGIVYGAMALLGGAGSSSWVKWLPDDIDVAVQVRVADSLNAPVFKPIMDHPTLSKLMNQPPLAAGGEVNPTAAFFQTLNVQAKDIDTLTVGFIDLIQPDQKFSVMRALSSQIPQRFVAVVKFKTAVDVSKLASAPTVLAKEDYNGQSVYALAGSVSPKVLIHAVNSTTYLVGSDAELKGAIDGKGAAAAKRFAFVDAKSSFVYAAAPKDTTKFKPLGFSSIEATASGVTTENAKIEGMYGVNYNITFGSEIKVEHRLSLVAAKAQATADQNKREIDDERSKPKTRIAALDGAGFTILSLPFPIPAESFKKLMGHMDTMLGSAQSTASGSSTSLTMTLSGQIVTDALAMATPYMPMLETKLAEREKAAAAAAAAAAKSNFGNSAMDITSAPGAIIDAGEKSKTKINALNDQYQADLEAQMQEGGTAHAAPAPAPAATPAANAGANDPAKAMHAAPAPAAAAPVEKAAEAEPAKAMHATAPAGGDGQNAGQPAEKPAANKSRSRRRTPEKSVP